MPRVPWLPTRSAANPEDAWILLDDDLGNWLAGREPQYTEAMVEGNKVREVSVSSAVSAVSCCLCDVL